MLSYSWILPGVSAPYYLRYYFIVFFNNIIGGFLIRSHTLYANIQIHKSHWGALYVCHMWTHYILCSPAVTHIGINVLVCWWGCVVLIWYHPLKVREDGGQRQHQTAVPFSTCHHSPHRGSLAIPTSILQTGIPKNSCLLALPCLSLPCHPASPQTFSLLVTNRTQKLH